MKTRYIISLIILIIAYTISHLISSSPIHPLPHTHTEQLPTLTGILSPSGNNMTFIESLSESTLTLPRNVVFEGPESFAFDPVRNVLFTGIADGHVVEIHLETKQVRVVTRMGKDHALCGKDQAYEDVCGRPLGMKLFDGGRQLVVGDAYLGVFFVDVQTGEKRLIADGYQGRKFQFINDVLIDDKGNVYFTDSSTFQRRNFNWDLLEKAPHGALYMWDAQKDKVLPLANGFYFANGIEFHEGNSILVNELSKARITKISIEPSIIGKRTPFALNLPCYPDNLKYDEEEEIYWVGCSAIRKYPFALLDFLDPYVTIRKILAHIPKEVLIKFTPKYSLIIAINKYGDIVQSKHNTEGTYAGISEAYPVKDKLYLGSFARDRIIAIKK